MATEIYLPRDGSLKIPPLVRHLWIRLESWRSTARADAPPVKSLPSTSVLDKGCTQWVDQPMGREIRCTEGTLWLTFDGVRKDIILEAGQSFRCDCASRLSVHAVDAARFKTH